MNPGRKTQFLVRALTVVFALMISLVGNPVPAAERVTIATPSRGLFEFPVVETTVSARTRNWLFLPGFIFKNLSTIPSEHSC